MSVIDVSAVFDKAASAITDLVSNAEERGKALAALTEARASATNKVLDYEGRLAEAQSRIVEAEAKSEYWLTAMWRPILMLGFGYIVFHNLVVAPLFGLTPITDEAANLTPELWGLLKLGIGGYVIGRSGEKIAKSVAPVFNAGAEDLMKPKKLAKLKAKLAELEAAA